MCTGSYEDFDLLVAIRLHAGLLRRYYYEFGYCEKRLLRIKVMVDAVMMCYWTT